MPAHLLYILQPLNIVCFLPLKLMLVMPRKIYRLSSSAGSVVEYVTIFTSTFTTFFITTTSITTFITFTTSTTSTTSITTST